MIFMYYNDRNSPDYTYMYSLKGPIHTVIIYYNYIYDWTRQCEHVLCRFLIFIRLFLNFNFIIFRPISKNNKIQQRICQAEVYRHEQGFLFFWAIPEPVSGPYHATLLRGPRLEPNKNFSFSLWLYGHELFLHCPWLHQRDHQHGAGWVRHL